jgi:hypothetical protein
MVRVLPLVFAACVIEQGQVPVDDAVWNGDLLVDEVVITCDGGREWTYEVRTIGFGGDVTFDVVGRAYGAVVWREHGDLPEVDVGEDWALYRLTLDQVDSVPEEGVSTEIPCEAKTLVTYGFATWGQRGMDECIAWGVDPVGEFPDCASWGDNGHGSL